MNKRNAQKIAEYITNEQLAEMCAAARRGVTDWTAQSSVNKQITKGVAWNILGAAFDPCKDVHILAKVNMIWEFGDFLPLELMPIKKEPLPQVKPHFHQEPDDFDWL